MIKLGTEHVLGITVVEADGSSEKVELHYRMPTTSERHDFISMTASLDTEAPDFTKQLLDLETEMGARLLLAAENIEPPQGMSLKEAMLEHGSHYLVTLTRTVVEMEKLVVSTGESEGQSTR